MTYKLHGKRVENERLNGFFKKGYVVATLLIFWACSTSGPEYLVGAGHRSGYYYPAASTICKILNKSQTQFSCEIKTTSGGSAPNILGVTSDDFQFGIAQSDIVFEAYHGNGEWDNIGPQKDLRSVYSLYSEMLTLVAADDSNIITIKDLSGKRVNIGEPGSGHRIIAVHALDAAGINWKEDFTIFEKEASEGPKLLQNGTVDAFFYVLAHPSSRIKKAVSGKRKAHFVPIVEIESLLKTYPYYSNASIPIIWYPGISNKKNVPTFGVTVLLITKETVPDIIVYSYTKETFENINVLQNNHPACKFLEANEMIESLTIPIHAGAIKYYKENALLGQ